MFFFIWKFIIPFASLYLLRRVNSFIYLTGMFYETYNIDLLLNFNLIIFIHKNYGTHGL